jgi:hypothetical protein
MVVDFFNGIVAEQEAALRDLDNKRKEAEASAERRRRMGVPCPAPGVIERRTIRNSRMVSFLPFGAGQFQNGQSRKGWSFFAAQAAFGAISLGALTTNFLAYGFRPTLRCEPGMESDRGNCPEGYHRSTDRERSELLTKIQVGSGVLFFATAIWGVTDAILNFQPEVVVDSPQPAAPKPVAGATSRGPIGDLRLGPALLPGLDGNAPGGSLAFRF